MYKPWKILHIDLSDQLGDLPANPESQGSYVFLWWKDIPLGHIEISQAQLPLSASHLTTKAVQAITPAVGDHLLENGFEAPLPVKDPPPSPGPPAAFHVLKSLNRPLTQLHEHLSAHSQDSSGSTVSVVVCTRDRPDQLKRCLSALAGLAEQPKEIVVVDNAPRTAATRHIVDDKPGIHYVLEPKPGLSVARNAGIRHSTGDVIAFTDDDVIVHPNWTIRLKQALTSPGVMAATGLILPAELETRAQYTFQQGHGDFGWGYRALTFDKNFFNQMKHRGVPVWHIGAGASMAFRREAFEQVGLFDERLGAGAAGCSEDSEMWYRIIAEGGRCRYEPLAVVHHHHRVDMQELEHQMHHYMRGHIAALLTQFEKYGHWGNLYRALGILPAYYTRLLLRRLRGSQSRAETLNAEILGCGAGFGYYLKHRNAPSVASSTSDNSE